MVCLITVSIKNTLDLLNSGKDSYAKTSADHIAYAFGNCYQYPGGDVPLGGREGCDYLQGLSAAGLIVATMTGDLTSITSLAATLPTVLVDASFSREFEREADDAAIAWMKSAGIAPRRYAEVLGRLQAQHNVRRSESDAEKHPVRNYLSTHPDTEERIRHILKEGEK